MLTERELVLLLVGEILMVSFVYRARYYQEDALDGNITDSSNNELFDSYAVDASLYGVANQTDVQENKSGAVGKFTPVTLKANKMKQDVSGLADALRGNSPIKLKLLITKMLYLVSSY